MLASAGELTRRKQLFHRVRRFADELPERLPLDELHCDVVGSLVHVNVVDGDDVGMAQGGCGAGFPLAR